jgi:Glycosyl transferase family 2
MIPLFWIKSNTMQITVLIPHWRTLKMTAFTVSQYLKYKGDHDVDIIVIDNSYPDESIKGLAPFKDQITIINNTSDKLSSHGIAYDMAMEHVKSDWVLTSESDSYPTAPFVEYYLNLIEGGYDLSVSLLPLSGGCYGHPAAGLVSKKLWQECKEYCDSLPYKYFPNMMLRNNFSMHAMVHESILDNFLDNPEDWMELSDSYKPYSRKLAEDKMLHYSPVVGPFHNGMGGRQESIHTYGQRNELTDSSYILYNSKWQKLIGRIGYEPGQFLYYYAIATGKKVFRIPTYTQWLPDKENQQQEYTLNEAGIRHEWAISAYHDYTPDNEKEVALYKQSIPDKLYETLPPHQKI